MKMILRIPLKCKKRSLCFGTERKNPLYDGFSIKTHKNSNLSYLRRFYFSEWTRYCYKSRVENNKVW